MPPHPLEPAARDTNQVVAQRLDARKATDANVEQRARHRRAARDCGAAWYREWLGIYPARARWLHRSQPHCVAGESTDLRYGRRRAETEETTQAKLRLEMVPLSRSCVPRLSQLHQFLATQHANRSTDWPVRTIR